MSHGASFQGVPKASETFECPSGCPIVIEADDRAYHEQWHRDEAKREGYCEGCERKLSGIELAQCSANVAICMDCIKARARAATTGHKCKCGKKAKPGLELGAVNRRGARRWIPCRRCLGTIRQTA